ncbi:hypothetical protein SSTU70S_03813 [Stutzerimonas stutzeri]
MSAVAWWLLALPFIAGAFMPLQAGINGQLARQLSSVMGAALLSFAVGTLALLCVVAAQRDLPALQTLKGLSWWHWSGGLLGAFFIATAAFAAPRTGGAAVHGAGAARAVHGAAGSLRLGRAFALDR